jgi:hypothetical protein
VKVSLSCQWKCTGAELEGDQRPAPPSPVVPLELPDEEPLELPLLEPDELPDEEPPAPLEEPPEPEAPLPELLPPELLAPPPFPELDPEPPPSSPEAWVPVCPLAEEQAASDDAVTAIATTGSMRVSSRSMGTSEEDAEQRACPDGETTERRGFAESDDRRAPAERRCLLPAKGQSPFRDRSVLGVEALATGGSAGRGAVEGAREG